MYNPINICAFQRHHLFCINFCTCADYALFGAIWDKFALNLVLKSQKILVQKQPFGTNLATKASKKAPNLMSDQQFFNANKVKILCTFQLGNMFLIFEICIVSRMCKAILYKAYFNHLEENYTHLKKIINTLVGKFLEF